LDQNQDLPFGADGSKLAGAPSVRAGLIDALRQIGGPESVALSHQILQTSADPLEISLLTRNLEEAAPGQYRQEALDVARPESCVGRTRQAGGSGHQGSVSGLANLRDANTAAELEKLVPQWNYYATMALAGLPAGQGIPSLIKVAEDPSGLDRGQYKMAVTMLGQLSGQYPDAASALWTLLEKNKSRKTRGSNSPLVWGYSISVHQSSPGDTVPPELWLR